MEPVTFTAIGDSRLGDALRNAEQARAATFGLADPERELEPERPGHVERRRLPASVGEDPDGIDLGQLLAALQEESPDVQGVAVRDGQVIIISAQAPAAAAGRRIHALLDDPGRLPRIQRRSRSRTSSRMVDPDDVVGVLLDEGTDDQEWLAAFRAYATTHLISHERPVRTLAEDDPSDDEPG